MKTTIVVSPVPDRRSLRIIINSLNHHSIILANEDAKDLANKVAAALRQIEAETQASLFEGWHLEEEGL